MNVEERVQEMHKVLLDCSEASELGDALSALEPLEKCL